MAIIIEKSVRSKSGQVRHILYVKSLHNQKINTDQYGVNSLVFNAIVTCCFAQKSVLVCVGCGNNNSSRCLDPRQRQHDRIDQYDQVSVEILAMAINKAEVACFLSDSTINPLPMGFL